MGDIFISYAEEDRAIARSLAGAFEREGCSVFWDRTIAPGKRFDRAILDALEAARCVVVLWSRNSVESEWVLDEAERGKKLGILIPVLTDEVTVPLGFGRLQTIPLLNRRTSSDPNFKLLMGAVRDTLETDAPGEAATQDGSPHPDRGLGPRSDLPDSVRDPYGRQFGRVENFFARPAHWHCIYCGWRCTDDNNSYYCAHCTAVRPFFADTATARQCRRCSGMSLAIASFCEWCGAKFEG